MGRNSGGGSRRTGSSSSGGRSSGSGRISGGRTSHPSSTRSSGSSSSGRISSGRSSLGSSGSSYRSSTFYGSGYHSSSSTTHSSSYSNSSQNNSWDDDDYSPQGGYGYSYGGGGYRSGSCLGLCLALVVASIFVIIGAVSFFSAIFSLGGRHDSFYGYVAPQTVQQSGKEHTNSSSQPKTNYSGQSSGAIEPVVGEYFTDRLGWIKQSATLNAGMEAFFKKTGVKPYLYLTDNVYGSTEPSDKQMDTFANSLYDKLFTDENHFLLVFQEYGDYYMTWYVSGSDAAEVVDEEAANIVLDYVDEYYSSDMGEEEYFSNVFSMAAGDIMEGGQ